MSDARSAAKCMPNFKNELSKIEVTINSISLEVAFVPKAYYDLAGCSIEFVWGDSKALSRKENAALSNE